MDGQIDAKHTARQADPPLRLQDRYRLVEQIGEGSMGMIYRAYDETLNRDVAIKFLLPERVASQESGSRFLREARAVARLSHPNIMTLYDVGQQDEWRYLVLEYVPGKDLHSLMVQRGGPLTVDEALHAIGGALDALAYAHRRGIIHRDIKPENIMVTPEGQVRVTDFGLALARGEARLTREGVIVGTVLYLAPEVISGTLPNERSDLYAMGAVLYELLSGRPPFPGDDPLIVFSQILHAPLSPLREVAPHVPAALESFVQKLMAREADARYATAQETLDALAGLTGTPQATRAMPATAPHASPRPVHAVQSQPIRILLVDDQALFRVGLRTLLSVQPDFQIVGEAENGQDALRAVETYCPDVVLMDLRMPVLDGVAATRRLCEIRPDCRVVMLTTFDDDEYIFEGLRAGALGYLLKDAAPEVLYNAIRAAARGESVLQPAVAAKVVSQFARLAPTPPAGSLVEPLSEREIEVLALIAEGRTNREIAGELYIASGTVKNHVTNILGKLGVHDRTQAALKARELGLI
jgi:DNA-binding NarL/FixJ family response regulator